MSHLKKIKINQKGNLRDCVLSEGQILHEDVQTLIFFIQKLSYPPRQRRGTGSGEDSHAQRRNNDQ